MSDFAGLKVKPNAGTDGNRGTITTNCLRIIRTPFKRYWHYDVEFRQPDVRPKTRLMIIDKLVQENRNYFAERPVYDGNKNIYSPGELDPPKAEFTVNLTYPRGEYTVFIQLGRVILPVGERAQAGYSADERLDLGLMNGLVRQYPSNRAGVTSYRRGFYTNAGSIRLRGIDLWRGIITSVRPTIRNFIINIDTSLTPMYTEGPLIDALMSYLNLRDVRQLHDVPQTERRKIMKYLKNLRVSMAHLRDPKGNPVVKKIVNLQWESAASYTFVRGEEEITVETYFRGMNIRLAHPKLGILAMLGKSAALPLELLKIVPGQPYRGVLSDDAARKFLQAGTQKPPERLRNLKQGLEPLGLDSNGGRHRSEYLQSAGVQVEQDFMHIPARVLEPPALRAGGSGGNNAVRPRDGAWNMTRHTVFRPVTITHVFAILTVKIDDAMQKKEVHESCDKMFRIWHEMGIDFGPNTIHRDEIHHYEAVRDRLVNIGERIKGLPRGHILILVIVQDSAKQLREATKWFGDVWHGIPTQVLKESKLRFKGLDQYARNVGLKINAKMHTRNGRSGLNVIPMSLDPRIMDDSPMIVGLDTSHPLSGSSFPTTAAMVYSIDEYATEYRSKFKFQQPRQEIIGGLDVWFAQALAAYAAVQKKAAKRVIVYRDGVSEGQFGQVYEQEVKAVQKALQRTGAKLTFIIVGKKHHIRFFPTGGHMADRNQNAVPGTIVDTDITTPEPNVFDFYLASHGAILGTSRPAHYSVIHDDSGLDGNQLEKFSHDLCYVYQIATRSVSIPAPVYYADKLAGRSAIMCWRQLDSLERSSTVSDEMTYSDWVQQLAEAHPHAEAENRMYWL